jgi:hypothetical protein
MVLREVEVRPNGTAKFTGRYSNSEQHVLSLESVVDVTTSRSPHARVYLDCRMKIDTRLLVAHVSRLKEAHENFVLNFGNLGTRARSIWKRRLKRQSREATGRKT